MSRLNLRRGLRTYDGIGNIALEPSFDLDYYFSMQEARIVKADHTLSFRGQNLPDYRRLAQPLAGGSKSKRSSKSRRPASPLRWEEAARISSGVSHASKGKVRTTLTRNSEISALRSSRRQKKGLASYGDSLAQSGQSRRTLSGHNRRAGTQGTRRVANHCEFWDRSKGWEMNGKRANEMGVCAGA